MLTQLILYYNIKKYRNCTGNCHFIMLRIYEIMFITKFSQYFQCSRWCLIFLIMSIFPYFVCFEFSHLLVIYLWIAFCCLLYFNKATEGVSRVLGCRCFAFLELFLQVSLPVHFLQYLDGLFSILFYSVLHFWTDVHEVLLNCSLELWWFSLFWDMASQAFSGEACNRTHTCPHPCNCV